MAGEGGDKMPYFNIPCNVKHYFEEREREENLGKEMADRIINSLKQSIKGGGEDE